jgi:L-rhamnose mutarotase
MAKMAADPRTQEWWAIMKPKKLPPPPRALGEGWAEMEEVVDLD